MSGGVCVWLDVFLGFFGGFFLEEDSLLLVSYFILGVPLMTGECTALN